MPANQQKEIVATAVFPEPVGAAYISQTDIRNYQKNVASAQNEGDRLFLAISRTSKE